jgi:hypothetical protein
VRVFVEGHRDPRRGPFVLRYVKRSLGCQRAIAAKVIEREGNYVLTVKEHQEHLLADIQAAIGRAAEHHFAGVDTRYR